mgnify:CR=1 FL=1
MDVPAAFRHLHLYYKPCIYIAYDKEYPDLWYFLTCKWREMMAEKAAMLKDLLADKYRKEAHDRDNKSTANAE